MERPNRPKNQDKWRRIIQPAGDSDSSDWSSDSDFGLLLNRYRGCKPMAGHSSSSSTNERPASPVDVNGEDAVQNNETSDLHNNTVENSPHQLNFFNTGLQKRVTEDKDIKPLGNIDVESSSDALLHHNYAERMIDSDEFDAQADPFWLLARRKLSLLRDRPYYLGGPSDRDCGLPTPSSGAGTSSGNTDGTTSNMPDCWAEYVVNLKRRTPPPPPPPPIRKRLFVGYNGDDSNANQVPLAGGSSSVQDIIPSTSSDVQLHYSPLKDLCTDWLAPKKSSGHGYNRSCFPHQTTNADSVCPTDLSSSVTQSMEDSSEVQIVSILDGPSRSNNYCSAPPPIKKVRWCVPEIDQFYDRYGAADLTTAKSENTNNVEVINLEETATETSSGPLKSENDNVELEKSTSTSKPDNNSESCEEQQPGPSQKRNEDDELLNQGIIGLLECPVCMEYMGPPINQCRRGHLICSHCKPKLATCPTCRSRFSEQRNLAMEKVAEKLHYPCKNVHMGCTHTLRLGDREEHESNCEHRNYRCAIVPPCDWRGQHHEILQHIRIRHSEALLFGAEHELKMILGDFSEQTSVNWVVSALGELFRVNLGAVRGGRVQVFGCVIFLGPAYRASHFKYSLTVGPNAEDTAKRSLTFSRATHCYVDRCSVYYSSGDCFHLRTESAQLFCVGPCNILKVKLKIERMEKHQ